MIRLKVIVRNQFGCGIVLPTMRHRNRMCNNWAARVSNVTNFISNGQEAEHGLVLIAGISLLGFLIDTAVDCGAG